MVHLYKVNSLRPASLSKVYPIYRIFLSKINRQKEAKYLDKALLAPGYLNQVLSRQIYCMPIDFRM